MDTRSVEIEGKTIDAAIEKACEEFGLPRERLNIEIISEGSTGFLGGLLGAKKARIKASVMSLDLGLESRYRSEREPATTTAPTTSPREYTPAADDSESLTAKSKELLEGILERMGLDFPVHARETSDTIQLNIEA